MSIVSNKESGRLDLYYLKSVEGNLPHFAGAAASCLSSQDQICQHAHHWLEALARSCN